VSLAKKAYQVKSVEDI